MNKIFLEEFCDFQKGFAFRSKDYATEGTRIIKVSDLNEYNITLDNCVYIKDSAQYENYKLLEDDVIITTVGSWETSPMSVVGKVVRVQKEAAGSLLNQNAVRVRTKNPLDQKFLFYLLKNKTFKNYIVSTARGSASQASITQNSIKNFSFILPDEKTRRSIAKILNDIDKKRDVCIKYQSVLLDFISEVYKELFLQFNDFTTIGTNVTSLGWKRR